MWQRNGGRSVGVPPATVILVDVHTVTTQVLDQPRSYRIHAAMVLFSLEEALGNFVVSSALDTTTIPQPLRLEIERRLESTGFVPVSQIVQETFLREVIELSVTVLQKTGLNMNHCGDSAI